MRVYRAVETFVFRLIYKTLTRIFDTEGERLDGRVDIRPLVRPNRKERRPL